MARDDAYIMLVRSGLVKTVGSGTERRSLLEAANTLTEARRSQESEERPSNRSTGSGVKYALDLDCSIHSNTGSMFTHSDS
jgi:hypothetical protein